MANLLYPATTGHYTDDKYSPLVEPNLFALNVFQPGVTFTDKYQIGPAGQIFVHKPGIAAITPTAPGADFSDAIVQDSLITIALNKQFNRSRKIYGATAASVAYDIAAAELETGIREVRKAWNLQAAKAICLEPGIMLDDNILTVANVNGSDIYDTIVASRQKLRDQAANPDTLLVSPSTYAKLLKAPEFQRTGVIGDNTVANGMVGRVAGLNVFEYEDLKTAIANGEIITDYNGGTADITWVAADDELEYIMYDSDAFSIVTSVEAIRVVDEPTRFVGTLAQVQIVSGYKLTNPKRALLKVHDASAS
jgi:hypothetical protein